MSSHRGLGRLWTWLCQHVCRHDWQILQRWSVGHYTWRCSKCWRYRETGGVQ